MGIFQIQNGGSLRAKNRSLITGRHVSAGPVLGPTDGPPGLIQHHHVTRKILIDRPQPIIHPGTQGRPATENLSTVHHQHGRTMNR